MTYQAEKMQLNTEREDHMRCNITTELNGVHVTAIIRNKKLDELIVSASPPPGGWSAAALLDLLTELREVQRVAFPDASPLSTTVVKVDPSSTVSQALRDACSYPECSCGESPCGCTNRS